MQQWVIYLLFGANFSVGAQGFPDKPQCEALRVEIVKVFKPTRSACLLWSVKTDDHDHDHDHR